MSSDISLSKNILIKLLKVITDEEWKEFEKFVGSPFFNDGRNYLPLLKILKKHHPKFDSEEFTKERIYQKLFPDKDYKESVLNSMFSRLFNIGEEFLIHIAIKNEKGFLKERLIIKELRSRGVMLKLGKSIENNLKHFSEKQFNENDFRNLHDIYVELNKLNQVNNRSEIFYNSINELTKYTTYTFLFELSLNLSSLYSLKNYWTADFDKSHLAKIYKHIDFEEILKVLEEEDYKNFVPMKLTYLSYMATKHPETNDYFYEMKSLFQKESEKFGQGFRETVLTNLSAICSSKMLHGNSEFKLEAFEIRKMLIEENILLSIDEYLKAGDFRSIFIDAMNVGQIEWGKSFLEKSLNKIHPDFRQDVSNYCNSWIAYENKDYDKAVEYANKVNINQITFKLDLKNIISRAYYDTNSTEALLSLLSSYYQLIQNSDSQNKAYLLRHKNFVKYLRKLILIREKGNHKLELEVLRDNIQSDNVSGRSWLLKKVDLSSS